MLTKTAAGRKPGLNDRGNRMNRWEELMVFYGHAHRNPINILIHVVGVPVIVCAALTPAAWLRLFDMGGVSVTGAWVVGAAGLLFYFTLDVAFAAWFTPIMIALVYAADQIAAGSFQSSATFAVAGFFGGYGAQFIGHAIEGRKPSLFTSVWKSMVTAPLFFVAEIAKVLGLRKDLFTKVDAEIARRDTVSA